MNVVGYIRVSTQGQAKDGYSLKYQEDEIKGYCKEQGWNLIHIFRDEGISGAKLNEEALEIDRVGLQEMLAHLSSVQVDYVVVLNTSRLWRSDIVKVLIQRKLKKYEDGESVPSQFFIDFNIDMDETDEDTIEKAVYKNSSSDISALLDGCSYEEIVIPKIQKSINLNKSYNAVILIYNFQYKSEISSTGAFDFIATTNYE